MSETAELRITLVGAGTIGLSLAALHVNRSTESRPLRLVIHDTRPELRQHIMSLLPLYINTSILAKDQDRTLTLEKCDWVTIIVDPSLPTAVYSASIIQEQGPENEAFKTSIWPQIEAHCPPDAQLWSSTSGIPASTQSQRMKDPSRLIIVHPFNPPHIMPLLEVIPSPHTSQEVINRTMSFWQGVGRTPVLLKKECTGFVANRLAFALLREAIHLVDQGVASVEDIDTIVQNSMGPRWAVAGPFKSYHAGGGEGGLEAFFRNIGGTVQSCWDAAGKVHVGEGWGKDVFKQTTEAYGVVDTKERDETTRRVLAAVGTEGFETRAE